MADDGHTNLGEHTLSANPSAQPVQKLRVRYAKQGRLRFSSHRDVARAIERALRRAKIPMAYSQGFSPHPKISWAGAVPTGVASIAEYLELQLVERRELASLHADLAVSLPEGLDLIEVVEEAGPGALADRLEASSWQIELPGVPVEEVQRAVQRLLAADSVEVERMTKNGWRGLDARAPLVSAEVRTPPIALGDQNATLIARVDDWRKDQEPYGILVTVVRQTTPVVRPDDVLSAFRVVADLVPPVAARAIRLAQGQLDDAGGLSDPLAQDRATAGARRGEPAAE